MTTYESLRKARKARLTRFTNKYVTGKEGGQPFGNFMSLEGTLDNADSDIQVIKELEGRLQSEFERFCEVVPALN